MPFIPYKAKEPKSATPSGVQVRIRLPEEVLNHYQQYADQRKESVDDVLAQRLAECADYTSTKPLYFSDSDRMEMEHILGKNLAKVPDALMLMRTLSSVRVANTTINLQPGLLTRLKSRCLGMKWETFLEQRIIHALEQYVGLR